MRVLIVSSGMAPQYGGAARSEAELARALESRSLSVMVACPAAHLDVAFASEQLNVFFPFTKIEAVAAAFGIRGRPWKEISRADVVHFNGHWRWESFFLTLCCRFLRTPYVIHPRGMFWVGHRKIFLKKCFNLLLGKTMVRHAGLIILLSQMEAQDLEPYSVSEGKTAVIPNGIGLPKGIAKGKKRSHFLYLGRIEARKNLLFLVRAHEQYLSQGGRFGLQIVGPSERGYAARVNEEIKRLGTQRKARVLGPVYGEKKWQLLAHCQSVVYPSLHEPFGRTPFEALGVGSYAIVPRGSGGAEYLGRLLPQGLYDQGDLQSLVGAFFWVESQANGKGALLQVAKHWVRTQLNWSKVAHDVIGEYEKILAPAGQPEAVSAGVVS